MTPIAWLGLLLLAILYFEFYLDMMTDTYRQNLFTIRDELFIYAMNGHISFEHPAYHMLRNMLNGSIRFGHRMSLGYILGLSFSYSLMKKDDAYVASFKENWKAALDSLPAEVAVQMEETRMKMHVSTYMHIVFRSPLLVLTLVSLVVVALLRYAGASLKRKVFSRTSRIHTPILDNLDWSAWREASTAATPIPL